MHAGSGAISRERLCVLKIGKLELKALHQSSGDLMIPSQASDARHGASGLIISAFCCSIVKLTLHMSVALDTASYRVAS